MHLPVHQDPFENKHSPRRWPTRTIRRTSDDGLRIYAPSAADVTQPLRWSSSAGDAYGVREPVNVQLRHDDDHDHDEIKLESV